MNLPRKYQVFPGVEVGMCSKDEERLSFYLSNWVRLSNLFVKGVNVPDLRRLLVLELMGKKRRFILDRIIGRISTLQKAELHERVDHALGT